MKILLPRQGAYKAPKPAEKGLRLSQMPLKEELKKRATEQSQVVRQTVTNLSRRQGEKLPTAPVYCSFPDFKSIVLNDRKLDFSRREVTKKPNS